MPFSNTGFGGPFPPGLAGFMAARQANEQTSAHNLAGTIGAQGLLAHIQQQQQAAQVHQILAQSQSLDDALPKLMQVGPLGIQVAHQLSTVQHQQQQTAQGAREAAVFSPANIAANTTLGQPAQPAIPAGLDELGGGPGRPAQPAMPGQVNMDALRQQSMMTSPRAFEAGSAHIATVEATKQARRDMLETRLYDIESRSQDRALSREQQLILSNQANQTRQMIAALVQSNRQELPVQTHTDDKGQLWERKRGGGWELAKGPKGEQITTAQPGAAKEAAKQLTATQAFDALDTQITDLQTLIKNNEGMVTGTVGPKGFLGRTLETAQGLVPGQEFAATPALQAQSKKELIIGNIRSLMDSGHFSNADKQRIDAAIGTSNILTTPGNAIESLNNLRQFVNQKRVSGGSRKPPEGKPKAEDFFR